MEVSGASSVILRDALKQFYASELCKLSASIHISAHQRETSNPTDQPAGGRGAGVEAPGSTAPPRTLLGLSGSLSLMGGGGTRLPRHELPKG